VEHLRSPRSRGAGCGVWTSQRAPSFCQDRHGEHRAPSCPKHPEFGAFALLEAQGQARPRAAPQPGPAHAPGGSGFSAGRLFQGRSSADFSVATKGGSSGGVETPISLPPPKPDPAPDTLLQQTFPKGFTINLFSFPLAAAHEIRPAGRAESRWDYKIAQAGRGGVERFYSPGPSSRAPPASPRRVFLRGRGEMLRAGGWRGRGLRPCSEPEVQL